MKGPKLTVYKVPKIKTATVSKVTPLAKSTQKFTKKVAIKTHNKKKK